MLNLRDMYLKSFFTQRIKTTKLLFILLQCYDQSLMIKLIIDETLALINAKNEYDITAWHFFIELFDSAHISHYVTGIEC